ncbi:MAG: Xaa-Pro peptidase family protein [Anaerolineales bacterium]|jgi:Xaa-Pro dipeptidase
MPNRDADSIYQTRQMKLAAALGSADLDAVVLNPGPSLYYLSGLHFHLSERPVVLIFSRKGSMVIVLPELEAGKVENLPFEVRAFPYGEDHASWREAFRRGAQAASLEGLRVGVEPRRLRVLELRLLEEAAPRAQFTAAEETLASLRMYKDEAEIAAMRQAVDIAQRALQATLPAIQTGMTERQLASELTLQLLRNGSDPDLPFAPIVASGPNSANPHAAPSDRRLVSGDLLVLDWGASMKGYLSDLTRTISLGEPRPEHARIAQVVLEANAAARALAAPGVRAGEVDQAARAVIEEAGYRQYFTHRTGHGLGLEGHEEPYIMAGSSLALEAGMTFTIEPGIYLPGQGGVRIEDDFLITSSGGESLSDLPRDLIIL